MRAIVIVALIASVCLIGGCDGTALVVNVSGQWSFKIEFNYCEMFGFMKGGPSNAIVINITQTGDQLSAEFSEQGVDWEMSGYISGYRTTMWWTGKDAEGRVIEIASEARFSGTAGGSANETLDGICVVQFDSLGLCFNEQFGLWADQSGTGPQAEPPPTTVIIQQCPGVEICFLMDTSGSMTDESAALCAAISQVESDLRALGLRDIKVSLLGITSTGGSSFVCLTDSARNLFGNTVPGSGDTLNSSEDWGPGTAVIAANKNWTPGFVRIIVPISDEGPENGNSCSTQSDTDSITNAIAIASANNVIVSPIAAGRPGSPPDPCVLNHATNLANGTGGIVSESQDPSGSFAQTIFDIIVAGCSTSSPVLSGN